MFPLLLTGSEFLSLLFHSTQSPLNPGTSHPGRLWAPLSFVSFVRTIPTRGLRCWGRSERELPAVLPRCTACNARESLARCSGDQLAGGSLKPQALRRLPAPPAARGPQPPSGSPRRSRTSSPVPCPQSPPREPGAATQSRSRADCAAAAAASNRMLAATRGVLPAAGTFADSCPGSCSTR
ncbi:hypothetical protein NDU88_004622 [Pleurodeles waltl]|uniref:Uncharacterized protein n=1 Tax=Pleurodeles waltl TaxID=8319 RepID=A0AAV7NN75_PLEWA|nr:hypothetical protein NDU88_004622 [Pleurodeles waltl]